MLRPFKQIWGTPLFSVWRFMSVSAKPLLKTTNLKDVARSVPLSGSPDLAKTLKELNVRIPKGSKMPARPKPPPEGDFEEKFIKGGSGHGGQKINKTNSKVQLTHKETGIVITCQETRSRDQNRKIARQLLAERLDVLQNGILSRKGIVSAAKQVKAQRKDRKKRKKYKILDAERELKNITDQTEQVSIDNDGSSVIIIEEKDK